VVIQLLPMVFTAGWASGINPYLVVLLMGLAGRFADVGVPEALTRTDVLVAAAVLTAIDFVADKVAYLDSGWDALNTVVRPVAGTVIALLISGDATSLQQAVLAATGGATALVTHLVKAGVRVGVNTSPEPVSNVVVSLGEDVAVAGVVSLSFVTPWVAAAVALVLLVTGLAVVGTVLSFLRRRRRAQGESTSGP
jgi:hypothetical protein